MQHTVEMNQPEVNLKFRDPEDLNPHIKVNFHSIFGEPDPGIHSFDFVWSTAYKIFNLSKLWSYRILTVIFAIPLACMWGCCFACTGCCHIWCCQPQFSRLQIDCVAFLRLFKIITDTICTPAYVSLSYIFSNIRVTNITAVGDNNNSSKRQQLGTMEDV